MQLTSTAKPQRVWERITINLFQSNLNFEGRGSYLAQTEIMRLSEAFLASCSFSYRSFILCNLENYVYFFT